MGVVKYNCINCGGSLIFKPDNQKWFCEYCRGQFTLEELNSVNNKYERAKSEEHTNFDVYKCDSCGAELISKENDIVTTCTYCRSKVIIKDKLVGKYLPKYIIPFSRTLNEVKESFYEICKRKLLIPQGFRNINNYQVRGIYIPFWLFDIKQEGIITFNGYKISSYRRGDYIITNKKVYNCFRAGNVLFERIPNDGSVKMDDALMNSIEPFDYSKLVEFNPGYLSGFQAEKYDIEVNDCKNIVEDRAKKSAEEAFMKTVKGYSSVEVNKNKLKSEIIKSEYCLLPAWLIDIEFKNKKYSFTMNGETGKFVGYFPIDNLKLFLLLLLVFMLCIIIVTLIFFVKYF